MGGERGTNLRPSLETKTRNRFGFVLGFGFFSSLVDISSSDDAIVAFDLDKIFHHEVSS